MIWKIRLLAWLHIVLNGLVLTLGTLACASLGLSSDPREQETGAYVGFFFALLLPLLLPGLIGGIGLLRRRPWARILMIILSGLLLLEVPVGTLLGGFGLWVLLSREARAAFSPPERGPGPLASSFVTWRRGGSIGPLLTGPVIGVLLCMLMVAAGFVLFLAIGFRLSGEEAPPGIDSAALAAALILVPVMVAGVRLLTRKWRRRQQNRRSNEDLQIAAQRRRDERIAELATDAVKQKYIPLVARGESWSDEQIAYQEDRRMSGTCSHLQPIELAMREADIEMRRITSVTVSAKCRVNQPAVERLHPLQPPVYYVEAYQGERAANDFPTAFFTCKTCYAAISVLHPDQARAGTRWFPQAPAETVENGSA